MVDNSLRKRVNELMQEKNVNQKMIALELGITQSTLSRNLNGVHEAKADVIKKIADYFGVTIDYLLGNISKENNLKKLRLQKRLTLDELSLKVNITKSVLADLENDAKPFTQEYQDVLSKFFNVSVDYLMGITSNKNIINLKVADADGSITSIEYELLDKMKGFTVEDFQKVSEYIDFIKSRKI